MGNLNNWKKNIVFFLAGQNISLIGSALVQYAISWYIILETQSGTMLSISIICGFLPTFLISPFAGVWADRFNKKHLIIISDSVIAISTLILAVLFLIGYNQIWWLFIVSVIRALGAGVQTPTINAFIPSLVPSENLMKVNATNTSIQSVVALISPMLSGVLLTVSNIEAVLFVDVVTAAIAVCILLFLLRLPNSKAEMPKEKQKISYFGDLKLGLKYIKGHNFIRTIFIFSAVFYVLCGPLMFLTPLQVARTFGEEVWRLTVLEISFSIGMIAGGIIMTVWGGFKKKVHTAIIANFIIAIATFALGVVPIFWIYLAVMGVIGLMIPTFNTPYTVLLQQNVDPSYLGRVFSVLSMMSSLILPLSMLGYGPLADYVKIEWLLIITGGLLLVFCFFMLANKTIMKYEDTILRKDEACGDKQLEM